MRNSSAYSYVGVLLAAGRGTRFDPLGKQDKLQQILPSGSSVAATSAANLLALLPVVVAVVRPDALLLAQQLAQVGCMVVICHDATAGMANSLICGVLHARDADGWVIALGDMPRVQPVTIGTIVEALRQGAGIVSPTWRGQRGNPIGFASRHLQSLLRLTGDEGARRLLAEHVVTEVPVEDPGVHEDIDCEADLHRLYS
ncbi:MAG: nucleotidyltransferase family protein [Burkholderiaceae bacterium]